VIVSFLPKLFDERKKEVEGVEVEGVEDLSKSFGSISLGRNPLTIHSFNTLNPDPVISAMTFSAYFGEDKMRIAELDKNRFKMRKEKIIEMINSWMKKNTHYIIFLQEVNKELLDYLTSVYGPMVKHTNGKDISVSFQKKVKKEFEREEYRVTISNLDCIHSEDMELVTSGGNKKNALFCKYKYEDRIIDSFNIHFHFSSTELDISYYAEKIRAKVGADDICVVCGDFNKDVRDVDMVKFKKILLINDPEFVNYDVVKGDRLYTGLTGLVDNILVGNTKPVISIQSKFNDADILYDIEELHNVYELNPKEFNLPYDKYFSDHKPISTTIYV
jgi:hypothetical protein